MNRLGVLPTTLALVALAVLAQATPIDPNPDRIGVYFDLEGISTTAAPSPYTPLCAYLLATNPSRPAGISGWEATVLINPTSFPAGITFDLGPECLPVLDPPYFQVGWAVSKADNPILLLTIIVWYWVGPITFGVGPCIPSSFGGLTAGYADGADPAILVPLTVSGDVPWTLPAYPGRNSPFIVPQNSFVCACVNDACAVATEPSSWGSVKALYR